ncbi:MAG: hypothetical protein RLO80_07065 [Hyphomonas sp.]
MKLNPIKRHHLVYALRRSWGWVAMGVIFFGAVSVLTGKTVEVFLYSQIPIMALGVMFFVFHLWKVLKDR